MIQPDICHDGGIKETMKIGAMAETYDVKVAPHNPNGPVGTWTDVYGFAERKTTESFRQACTRFIYTENLMPQASVDAASGPQTAVRRAAQAAPLIEQAIAAMEDDDGWITLGAIGSHLRNAYPDFDQRTYGYAKLSDLIRALDGFEVDRTEPGGTMRVRRKGDAR